MCKQELHHRWSWLLMVSTISLQADVIFSHSVCNSHAFPCTSKIFSTHWTAVLRDCGTGVLVSLFTSGAYVKRMK